MAASASRAVPRLRRAADWAKSWASTSGASQMAAKDLVQAIKDGKGLVSDRQYHLRTYKNCFVGSEVVKFVESSGRASSRSEAVDLASLLVVGGFAHHVCDDHEFKDQELFYRFYEGDGETSVRKVADKALHLDWVAQAGMLRSKELYLALCPEDNALYVYHSDIASEPTRTMSFEDVAAKQISDLGQDEVGFMLVITDAQGHKTKEKFSTFGDEALQQKWIQAFVKSGFEFVEDQSALAGSAESLFEFSANSLERKPVSFDSFKPQVCIVVNVASK
eukprot:m.477390 g.477390  ORF g.477390 m.477390 type:complete len:277 (-) comp20830_c0_seq1:888-1718(-)